jgi:hypothetical protein
MAGRVESKLKLLLKETELQKPPQHFTEGVMREIKAFAADRVEAEPNLFAALTKQALPSPPKNFTYRVQQQIRQSRQQIEEPIINKKAWASIFLFVLIYVIVAVMSPDAGAVTRQFDFMSIGKYLSDMFLRFRETFLYLGITMLTAILLLTLDYFLHRKLMSGKV